MADKTYVIKIAAQAVIIIEKGLVSFKAKPFRVIYKADSLNCCQPPKLPMVHIINQKKSA